MTSGVSPLRAPVTLDAEACDALVGEVLGGRADAYPRLCAELWPFWTQVARRTRSLTLLGRGEDGVRDVAVALADKLARDDHRALRQYASWRAANPAKSFTDWMTIVTTNAIRSYVRQQTAVRPASDGAPSRNRVLREFFASVDLDEVGSTPSMTPKQTARQIVEFAEGKLPPQQRRVLALWLGGSELEEIAGEVGLAGGAEAKKVLRAACARLRREFGA